MARNIPSLQNNTKGISVNHREHRSKKGRSQSNNFKRRKLRIEYKKHLEDLKLKDLE